MKTYLVTDLVMWKLCVCVYFVSDVDVMKVPNNSVIFLFSFKAWIPTSGHNCWTPEEQ